MLKHQIPIRTFADWDAATPGFVEADLVAHCGDGTYGTFLSTLVVTDVATGWVECQALLYRSGDQVIQGITRARHLIPFPLLGIDTDNGSEFITNELISYCAEAEISFTRGRAYHKNDQCYVEQKNGAVVRQFVGYDRFEGEQAYRQLIELYRALRLYVNFFQPSLKLKAKRVDGTATKRTYLPARTPFERLCAAEVLSNDDRARLEAIFAALDPVRLLAQIGQLQEAVWVHAILPDTSIAPLPSTALRFTLDPDRTDGAPEPPPLQQQKRAYHRKNPQLPRWWRTHPDPFAEVWGEVESWLETQPELTGVAVFKRLQQDHPNVLTDGQLRTLQRRVATWRKTIITTFDDQWLAGEVLAGAELPPLRATSLGGQLSDGKEETALAAGQVEQRCCSTAG